MSHIPNNFRGFTIITPLTHCSSYEYIFIYTIYYFLYAMWYISRSIYKWYKSVIILNILKPYLTCDSRHKGMKSVLDCIYCLLNNSAHVSLMSFSNLKMTEFLKYYLLVMNSWYSLVSIFSTYYSNSMICLFYHSISLELEKRGKVISCCPKF